MNACVEFEDVLKKVEIFPMFEKIRLINRLTTQIESEFKITKPMPRKSLRGLWKGVDINEDEITQARAEIWDDFPRRDINE